MDKDLTIKIRNCNHVCCHHVNTVWHRGACVTTGLLRAEDSGLDNTESDWLRETQNPMQWVLVLYFIHDLLAFYHGPLALVSVVRGALHNVWFLLKWAWNTSSGCCSLSWEMDGKELQKSCRVSDFRVFPPVQKTMFLYSNSVSRECWRRSVVSVAVGQVDCWKAAGWQQRLTWLLSSCLYLPYFLLPSWQ